MLSPFTHPHSGHFMGGKGLAFREIINLMPPHRRYVETHLGGGAVLRAKRPAQKSIGIDLDPRVIQLWAERHWPQLELRQDDACAILPRLNLRKSDLLYVDPPYPSASRKRAHTYRCEMSDDQHVHLLELLTGMDAMIIVSSYDNEIYNTKLAHWRRIEYRARTHAGMVTEVAWMNFIPGAALHDYSFVGQNFRDRERFRRRLESMTKRLLATNDLELNAALATIAAQRPEAIRTAAEQTI